MRVVINFAIIQIARQVRGIPKKYLIKVFPPDSSEESLPIAICRKNPPRHSNPHSQVRGAFRASSPAGSFLGGFRTPATAHLARSFTAGIRNPAHKRKGLA
jgi:hypothetical protein